MPLFKQAIGCCIKVKTGTENHMLYVAEIIEKLFSISPPAVVHVQIT